MTENNSSEVSEDVSLRQHPDDHRVGRLEMREGESECFPHRLLAGAHPSGAEDLETEARLFHLAGDVGHDQQVLSVEGIADGRAWVEICKKIKDALLES